MSDPRDDAFRRLLDAARRFNQRPSLTRRTAVVGAAFLLVDAYPTKREVPQFPRHVGSTPGHLLGCAVVAEWDRTLNATWDEKWPPEGIYCTCDDTRLLAEEGT